MYKIFFMMLFVPLLAFAGELSAPEQFVKFLIIEVQADRNIDRFVNFKELSKHPRHALSKEKFLLKLKEIDLEKIKFQAISPHNEEKIVIARMIQPYNLDFELQMTETGIPVKPLRWLLVAMHP